MKKYLFTIRLVGFGNNEDEAWIDAIDATNLQEDSTPDKDDWEILSEDINED